MPFTYTSRKGVTYSLYRIKAAGGKHRYILAQQSKKGEPVDAIPAGHRVNETSGGVVTVVKDEPTLVRPEEVAAVETAVERVLTAKTYRVVGQYDRIEIYEKVTVARYGRYFAMPEQRQRRFEPVLRFVLIDPEQRRFRVDQVVPFGRREEWLWLDRIGGIADLAAEIEPALATLASLDPLSIDLLLPAPMRDDPFLAVPARRDARRPPAPPTSVHQLKVTLKHSRPAIWRRILVPSDFTLDRLHDVLQNVMDWGDEHLHLFEIDNMTFSDPRYRDANIHEEATVRLNQVAPCAKTRFRYEYDFGDGWEHEVLVEAVPPPEPGQRYPMCVAGERATPPEDSGGIWRYGWMLNVLANPRDPDRREILDWLGGPIDPEAFDLDDVNRRLAKLR